MLQLLPLIGLKTFSRALQKLSVKLEWPILGSNLFKKRLKKYFLNFKKERNKCTLLRYQKSNRKELNYAYILGFYFETLLKIKNIASCRAYDLDRLNHA